jgi:hypothetical protein
MVGQLNMNFNFVGLYVKSVSEEMISLDIDQFIEKLNCDEALRAVCRVSQQKGSILFEDITIRINQASFNYQGLPFDYGVYVLDDLIGYTNVDFTYTGLKSFISLQKSQDLIEEITLLEKLSPNYTFYRDVMIVGLFEWLDQVLKGHPNQIHKHYKIKCNSIVEIHLKVIISPNQSLAKKIDYKWSTNIPSFESEHTDLISLLDRIFIKTAK